MQRFADLISLFSKLLFVALLLAIVLVLAFTPELRDKLMIGWAGAGAIVVLAALALASRHALGGPRRDLRAALAIATGARNLGLALYVAESTVEMTEVIPIILTYALLTILFAVPWSRCTKGRLQAGQADPPAWTG